ncbi:MAG TPA: isoprenylcysteine carboxylmethyltransferase family protein [Burkholderiales bacterium]|jgi:protein-S-isoprenylcysteine O-methyltransferase Ste14|nr:isoprenylcysteine carboxylmethyltransferase family protein [Burkholderiales bacterium]
MPRPILAEQRMLITRLAVLAALAYATLARPPAYLPEFLELASELAGYVLLVIATLGRVWCLIFIGGNKNKELVTTGPYSVVRNPLYVFNFVGLIGLGLAVEQPTLAAVLAVMFWIHYPAVVAREEAELLRRFGPAYAIYREKTPRWMPRFAQYHEPPEVSVSPLRVRRGIFGAMWLLWAFLLWEVVERLHYWHVIPQLF